MSFSVADRLAGATRSLRAGSRGNDARLNSPMPQQQCLRRADLGQPDLAGFVCNAYQLGLKLGGGGMGVVYRAVHQLLGKEFAIKFVSQQASDQAELTERFVQELKAIGQLNHPQIVNATDAGEVDGVPYYVTELLDGHDLVQWVTRNGPADVGTACEMIRLSALGLGHAHRHGFLHRDVKPSNLFYESCGNIKLLDFGLVRSQQSGSDLTSAGQVMGTVDYCSPEQAEDSRRCTPASDLYSLGATLIYLLSGQPPFPDHAYPTLVSKLRGHSIDRPAWLIQAERRLPANLVKLLDAMLAKSPAARPSSCEEVAQQLATWARPLATRPATGEAPINSSKDQSSSNRLSKPQILKRVGWTLVVGLVLQGAFNYFTSPAAPPDPPADASTQKPRTTADASPRSARALQLDTVEDNGTNLRLVPKRGLLGDESQ